MTAAHIRLATLTVLLLLGAAIGLRSWHQLRLGKVAIGTCEQMDAKDFQGAIQSSNGLIEAMGDRDPMLPEVARCRCLSLTADHQRDACLALADGLRTRLGTGWVSDPSLGLILVGGYLAADRVADALAILSEVEAHSPGDIRLLSAELAARAQNSDLAGIQKLPGRVKPLPADQTIDLRIGIGNALAVLGDVDGALAAMEPSPVAGSPKVRDWFDARGSLLGSAGRAVDFNKNFQRWVDEGGRPAEVNLYAAVIASTTHQQYGTSSTDVALREAIDGAPTDIDPTILHYAWGRLIGTYMNENQTGLALAAFDEATARGIAPAGVSRDEVGRIAQDLSGTGQIRFQIADVSPGDVLRVSPPADAPADARYDTFPLQNPGLVSVARPASALPVRWALVDQKGQALNSGATVVTGAGDTTVNILDRKPGLPVSPFVLHQAPGDGRRRVFVVVIDCGDWHLLRLLDARGELPVLHTLEAAGLAGVTTSIPAFTGVAMEKLAHPRTHQGETFFGLLHHLGMEAAGFESVGTNPLEGLSWVLPESPYLVDVVGATNKIAANLLFAVGDIDASRDMEVVGPGGRTEKLAIRRQRPLTEKEIAAFPGLGRIAAPDEQRYLAGLAAQLDLTVDLANAGRLDLLLLRLAQTDLMTHREFNAVNRSGQDNADNVLLWTYRYVDQRLGEVANALDADDVLIVMSDHGIQSSMLHSPQAVFVMIGGAQGHLNGSPEIAGIPRLLVDLLGVQPVAAWPDTGLSQAAIASKQR